VIQKNSIDKLYEVVKVSVFELEDYVTLETWKDIFERPAYQASIDTKKRRSYRVKGLYAFKEEDACCGASDCQKNHNRGFLVVYAGGKETNFCEECGQSLIGSSYDEQEELFQDKGHLRKRQIQLNAFLEQSENIKNRVKELKQDPYGANWLYQSLTGFQKAYPVELLAVLTKLANNKEDNAILNALTENDSTAFQVEQLQGLGIFNTDIKETLIGNILKPLKELETIAANPESNPSLSRFCKWADKIEDHFAVAETLVNEGRLFFNAVNMERLKSIPMSEKNTKLVRSIRWDCDGGAAK
jgi:hypothetical protein